MFTARHELDLMQTINFLQWLHCVFEAQARFLNRKDFPILDVYVMLIVVIFGRVFRSA